MMMELRVLVVFIALFVVASEKFPCGEDFGNAEGKEENEEKCRRCKGAKAKLVYHMEFAEGLGYSTCSMPHETGWEGFEQKATPDLGAMQKEEKEPEPLEHELTSANFDRRTRGQKSVLLKFFAPWCGHCLSMKPDWERLIADYKGNADVGVWSVDCVGSGKGLCGKFGVQSYPTLKYGNPKEIGGFNNYGGPRTYEQFKEFTTAAFEGASRCDPGNLDECTEAEKDSVAFYSKKSVKFLATEVERLEKKFKKKGDKVQVKREALLVELQKISDQAKKAEDGEDDSRSAELEKRAEEKEEELEKVQQEFKELDEAKKESDLEIMKAVKVHKEQSAGHDEL